MVYGVWCIVRCHHEYIYFYRTLDSNKVLVTVPGGSGEASIKQWQWPQSEV